MSKQQSETTAESRSARPIRIAYVIDHFIRGGGTENQLANLVDHLDRSRFEPVVFNMRPFWQEIVTAQPCRVFYLNVSSIFSPKAIRAVYRMWRFFRRERIDILQVYFFDSRLLGTIAGRLAGVPLIVFCRREMGWWHTRLKQAVVRRLARVSQYCLVNAAAIKEMVSRTEAFPVDRIEVVHNGVTFAPQPGSHPVSRSDLGIPEGAPVIGMVGNLRPVKRYDRLVRIAGLMKHRETHFIVIGRGPLLEKLQEQAADLGVAERFHFRHIVGAYYVVQLFDIGVLTSESEGLSNVLIEYALAGKPAVAFDVGGNREVVVDGETGFVVPDGDEAQVASKLDYLLDNHEIREEQGIRAAETARDKFAMDSMVRRTEQFYERILR